MTRIIRSDLEGVVHAHLHDGTLNAVVLQAGDPVPDDVYVGDHVLEPEDDEPADVATSARPAPVGASAPDSDEPADDELADELADDEDGELADDEGADGELADDEDGDGEPADDEDAEDEGLDAPKGNARVEEWAEYADALGVEYEPNATRTQIQAAIAASKG